MTLRAVTLLSLVAVPTPLAGQQWNTPETLDLVDRAVARRAEVRADSNLTDYRSRAHGFVFFLAQLGEGLSEPPRLVKSDELQLEVYWRTPGSSKQRIIGWRDRADLPTDIQYHRDHLGIVQNNFGDNIRLGQGDEVRDVPHPLSPTGRQLYDFAGVPPIVMRLPDRQVRVREIRIRPKDYTEPRIIGSLFVDLETAELVVIRFNFTSVAYLDDTLEDITIVLENGLWNRRFWLPRRQEIEIRRRTKWLDLPARGIIRGRWEIDEYDFNLGLEDSVFYGAEIVAAPRAVRDAFVWDEPFETAVRDASEPVATFDLEKIRGEIADVAGARALSGLARARPSAGSLSDLARFNRVEGVAVGLGWVFRPWGSVEIAPAGSYGFSDERVKGRLDTRIRLGRLTLGVLAERSVRDVADERVISPLLNSVIAQEGGHDFGDYYLADRVLVSGEWRLGTRGFLRLGGGVERSTTMAIVTAPARGSFRVNPPLGAGTYDVGRLTVGRRPSTIGSRRQVSGAVNLEGGLADGRNYVRAWATGRLQVPVGSTDLVTRGWAGWGSNQLPPHRAFVMGGRGTLAGETFRAWGGRYAVVGTVEWRMPVPFPAISLGPLASTGRQLVVAPFVGAGWAGGPIANMPWVPSSGVRPVVGLGVEWFHQLLRVNFGVRLRNPGVALTVDVRRDLWEIL